MHFVYIDETGDETSSGFSALAIPVANYRESFDAIKQFRRKLNSSDGIFTTTELHACRFTSGRGRLGQKGRGVPQYRRCEIFNEVLTLAAGLPNAHILNAFRQGEGEKLALLERLLNRIHKAVENWGSQAILIFDEGDNRLVTRLIRKMGVYNPIRSQYGRWPDGKEYRNFPLVSLLEDPVFRVSKNSYFIQVVDFCAYALFQKEKPTPSRMKFRLDQAFEERLSGVCLTAANPGDKHGIIR